MGGREGQQAHRGDLEAEGIGCGPLRSVRDSDMLLVAYQQTLPPNSSSQSLGRGGSRALGVDSHRAWGLMHSALPGRPFNVASLRKTTLHQRYMELPYVANSTGFRGTFCQRCFQYQWLTKRGTKPNLKSEATRSALSAGISSDTTIPIFAARRL